MKRKKTKERAKIVVAEDNRELRDILKIVLERENYMVKFVPDGFSLIAYLKDIQDVDVIVLDLMMPDKNGVSVFNTVRSVSPASRLIIYTAYPNYGSSVFAREADAFINKTDGTEKLLEVIKELLG